MLDPKSISNDELEEAVASIYERVELSGQFSKLFADTNMLSLLIQKKNQVIFGRRGTGKTHLLGRLKEYYRDTFSENKILPIFIDGRTIVHKAIIDEVNPGISLLVSYRRFLDAVIAAIDDFIEDAITLSAFEKLWPVGGKKHKLDRIKEILMDLKKLIRFGKVEIGPGEVVSEVTHKRMVTTKAQIGLDAKVVAGVKKLAEAKAGFEAGLSKASSKSAEDLMKVVYEGLTVINFADISEGLDSVIEELEPDAVMILFDEWSAIELDYQPFFAEMIHSTLVAGRRMFIKFGCIPFLTRLSATKASGQAIGFPIGEEVFVDVDLDRFYNPYLDPQSVTFFLLCVLQKHLGGKIKPLMSADFDDAVKYFDGNLFQDTDSMEELVRASAGVPRDFLRIFARAFHKAQTELPITLKHVRMATHDFFQEEKRSLVEERATTYSLFEEIFEKICLPSKTNIFFVSRSFAKNRNLQELWHHRLVHLLFEGHSAYAGNQPGTYDVYVIDYGRYILMHSSKKGEEMVRLFRSTLNSFIGRLIFKPLLKGIWKIPNIDDTLKRQFAKLMVTEVQVNKPDLEALFDDCAKFVIDPLITDLGTTTST